MKPFLVDVPVRVAIWIRPDCQRKQFEIIRQARPSILFLTSDGGRNENEWELIKQCRAIFDDVDWECTIYKIFEDKNLGLYTFATKSSKFIWDHVDRCIFLEDDYVMSVSFFRFCAELLEKYKDDERIQMITGNNPLEIYQDVLPYDYFFSENGWSIWGTATWRKRYVDRVYPLPYANDKYVLDRLKENLSPFWYKKAKGYANGEIVDKHLPAGEYYYGVNGALFHRVNIVPSRNMISNIGVEGTHSGKYQNMTRKTKKLFFSKTYEVNFPMKEPQFVIDDKNFARQYEMALSHDKKPLFFVPFYFIKKCFSALFHGTLVESISRHLSSHKMIQEK